MPPRSALLAVTAALAAVALLPSAPAAATAAPASSVAPTAAVAPAPPRGLHTVSLVLALPPGARRDATTLAQARAAIANVDAFYRRVSHGRIKFRAGRLVNWTKVSRPCSLSAVPAVARRLHLPMTGRRHVVLYEPVRCGFGGIGVFTGNTVVLPANATAAALAHELGHNLGLLHSNSSGCTVAFAGKPCRVAKERRRMTEYGDASDLMGGGDAQSGTSLTPVALDGSLGPIHLGVLGILRGAAVRRINPATVRSGTTVTLAPRSAPSGRQVLQLRWAGRPLYVSYLPPSTTPLPSGGPATQGRLLVQTPGPSSALLLPVSRVGDLSGPLAASTYRVSSRTVMEVLATGPSAVLRFRRVGPATPTAVRVTPGTRAATVTWKARAVRGLTGYEVRLVAPALEPGAAPEVVSVTVPAAARAAAVGNLRSGTVWRAHVIPLVAGGQAPAATARAFAVRADPAMLPGFPAVQVAGGTVHVDWTQPADTTRPVSTMTVEVRVFQRDGSFQGQSLESSSPAIDVPYSGHGRVTVTAIATYASGETYTRVLRRGVAV